MDTKDLEKLAQLIRYYILKMTHLAGSGHPTSCFSAVELMTMLYFKYLRYDLDHPDNPANDRVIFSKGHASALFYSLYAAAHSAGSGQAGKLTEEELMKYRTFDSPLEGHPTSRFLFTEAATGSLGQGLSVGAGEAWALKMNHESGIMNHEEEKIQDSKFKIQNSVPHVFVLLGDGELAEGSVWEAVNWAMFHKLDNLIAICDINRLGQSEPTMWQRNTDAYRRRFEGFGWATIVIDGHNFSEIDAAFQKALAYKAGPIAIIAHTIKGKGISHWEDKEGWHNKMLPKEEYEKALAELGKVDKHIKGVVQKPVASSVIPSATEGSPPAGPLRSSEASEAGLAYARAPMQARSFSASWRIRMTYKKEELIATKKAFGNALERLGELYPNLIVLDGDVANSTHTDQFAKKYPDRFLQMYIAEQNMVGVATGLARRGCTPFVTTFACFLTRAHDQIRMAPLSGVTIYFNGAYGGVSMGKDGPSQMGLEDIALFRAVTGSTVLYPSDPYQTERLVEAMFKTQGMVYIRTTREPTPVIYGPNDQFVIGGSKVHYSSREESLPCRPPAGEAGQAGSTNREVSSRLVHGFAGTRSNNNEIITVVAAGITLHEALKAQKELIRENIAIRVIDCYSIKPIDAATLKKAVQETKAIIIVEDHYPEGGLGEAVESSLCNQSLALKVVHLAVRKMPRSGTPEELLAFEEIDAVAIVKAVKKIL